MQLVHMNLKAYTHKMRLTLHCGADVCTAAERLKNLWCSPLRNLETTVSSLNAPLSQRFVNLSDTKIEPRFAGRPLASFLSIANFILRIRPQIVQYSGASALACARWTPLLNCGKLRTVKNNFKSKLEYNIGWDMCSVTRWLDYFLIFGHLQQREWAQFCHKFAKENSAFCQIRNKLSKICQSGKISPNLVTLDMWKIHWDRKPTNLVWFSSMIWKSIWPQKCILWRCQQLYYKKSKV